MTELERAAYEGDLTRLADLATSGHLAVAALSSALVIAIIHGRVEAVRWLHGHGADFNATGDSGQPPLFFARTLPMVSLLLDLGAEVSARDSIGRDALHAYLISVGPGHLGTGDVAVVRRLLAAGLEVRARNADRPHTLCAIDTRDLTMLEAVLDAGATPNALDQEGGALWRVLLTGMVAPMLTLLVRHGLDVNTRVRNAAADTTVLMEACASGALDLVRDLLDRGADVNAQGRGTALSVAEGHGHRVIVDLLLERGAKPLVASLDAQATQSLDEAERVACAAPQAPAARLTWARALAAQGFRAAAASELAAVQRLGGPEDAALAQSLSFEAPAGVRWSFAPFSPSTDRVAPRLVDARFPGARVTDGARVIPLVLAFGAPCTACDERGEQECSTCHGVGHHTSFLSGDDVDCEPRQECGSCRGLKFVNVSTSFGKGPCSHEHVATEMRLGKYQLRRCSTCGLASLYGSLVSSSWETGDTFACGVCGHFVCQCSATAAR
jgi:ankyrin repeat protein